MTVTGNVDGDGILDIAGAGRIELGGYAYQDVQFETGATGTLILDHSDINPVNEIYGAVAGVHFDLRDIIDNSKTKPSFTISGTHDEFTLTVTDGTRSANLYLTGGLNVYNTKSFTLGMDGQGGTLVTVV